MPRGANNQREKEYRELKGEFKKEGRYRGREEEVASRIVNKQRAQQSETRSERSNDRTGRSPDKNLPIRNYDTLTADEVMRRVSRLDTGERRRITTYERGHRNRKGLLERLGRDGESNRTGRTATRSNTGAPSRSSSRSTAARSSTGSGPSSRGGSTRSASGARSTGSTGTRSRSAGARVSGRAESRSTRARRTGSPATRVRSAGARASGRAESRSTRARSTGSTATRARSTDGRASGRAESRLSASGSAQTTTDHATIRRWAEDRNGVPSTVATTARGGEPGVLRIDFPGYRGAGSLREITWDEFFRKFDEEGLAFLYQDRSAAGRTSRFFKLVNRSRSAR